MLDIFVQYFRRQDIFRIGGDEFVILTTGLPEKVFKQRIADMLRMCEENFPHAVACGTMWTQWTENLEALITEADTLMYEDKKQIKNSYGPLSPSQIDQRLMTFTAKQKC